MAKIVFDEAGQKLYETGVDRVVLYPEVSGAYPKGVAWNGVTSVSESPSGAEDNESYADNIKYANVRGVEKYGMTIECFYYPDEWAACNGEKELLDGVTVGQQTRSNFGLSYRTLIGNDSEGLDKGYKLHLVYGASASPSEKSHETVNENPELGTFSFEISTNPVNIASLDGAGKGFKPSAAVTIDSTKVNAVNLAALEDVLYGTEAEEPRLPSIDELKTILTPAG